MFVPAACANAGASQFGVSWTETVSAGTGTEPCAVSARRASIPRHTVFQPSRTDNVARVEKNIIIIIILHLQFSIFPLFLSRIEILYALSDRNLSFSYSIYAVS